MKKDRFNRVRYFSFEEEEPCASWSDSVEALQITDSPREGEKFVIVEYHYSFANWTCFVCHYYATEETLREAFRAGLRKHLEKKDNARQYLYTCPLSPYLKHNGYLRTRAYEDFEKPWFLAKVEDKIEHDRIILRNHGL